MNIKVDRTGDMVLIHLAGMLNIDNLAHVEEVLMAEAETGGAIMAVYCEHLGSLDSSAIGFLVKFFKYNADRGIPLIICDLNPMLYRLFVTARLDRYFKIMARADFEARYLA